MCQLIVDVPGGLSLNTPRKIKKRKLFDRLVLYLLTLPSDDLLPIQIHVPSIWFLFLTPHITTGTSDVNTLFEFPSSTSPTGRQYTRSHKAIDTFIRWTCWNMLEHTTWGNFNVNDHASCLRTGNYRALPRRYGKVVPVLNQLSTMP
jgi:hypothetical protein